MNIDFNLPKASELADKWVKGQYENAIKQRDIIIPAIIQASDGGKRSVSFREITLEPFVFDSLKKLGYSIEVGGQYNDRITTVSW